MEKDLTLLKQNPDTKNVISLSILFNEVAHIFRLAALNLEINVHMFL